MSTSTYYNFIGPAAGPEHGAKGGPSSIKAISQEAANQLDLHRRNAMSPSSFTTSTSNSSSSLNSQFNSLTPPNSAPSSASSTTSSSAYSTASTTNLATPMATIQTAHTAAITNTPRSMASTNQRELAGRSSVTPTQSGAYHQLHHSYTLQSLEPKPLRPFKSQDAYIEAMKEDLAEWLNSVYNDLELTPDNFFSQLETGAIICRHANNVTQMGRNVMIERAATNSDVTSSGSDNDNSLTSHNETAANHASLGSPSPEHNERPHARASGNQNQFYRRHRHSTTNSSISSITTFCSSSASKQRLSLTGSSSGHSPRLDKTIDWFRVKLLSYKSDASPGTFFARDNICQFIMWCRSLNVLECLLFETDDLVARKNEKSFILCLLEVARIGFKVGMPTPLIIQLEQEIDREIENDAKLQKELLEDEQRQQQQQQQQQQRLEDERRHQNEADSIVFLNDSREDSNDNEKTGTGADDVAAKMATQLELNTNEQHTAAQAEKATAADESAPQEDEEEEALGPKPQVITNDLLSLHERVVQLLCQCTCPTQFPMVRIGDGKYKVGDKLIIFVRILRRHIMVRVGGGWQELSEFLRQKDPCRTKSPNQSFSSQQHSHTVTSFKQATPTPPHTPSPPATAAATATTMINMNNTSIPVSRSRLLGSGHHLNKGYRKHGHSPSVGRRLISGSASMSWLSHDS